MKKLISVLAIAAICISLLAGCGAAKPVETTAPVEMEHAEYTVYNTTGAKVTELYLYNVGSSDKGENLAAQGLENGKSVVITRDAPKGETGSITYVLEFTAEGMDTQKFETLHFEVASISLKSVDAAAGATPIAFAAP